MATILRYILDNIIEKSNIISPVGNKKNVFVK